MSNVVQPPSVCINDEGETPGPLPVQRLYVFADEAGCLTFNRGEGASKYFILCTVTMTDCSVGNALLDLRRKLAWSGAALGEYFHATADKQAIRDAVFSEICGHDFSIQATIMEKSKAQPQVRKDRPTFYKYGWFYHLKHGVAKQMPNNVQALVTAAALGTRREKIAFSSALDDVLSQTLPQGSWKTDFPPAASDPCVQVADYCAWALQRKWEREDCRSFNLIKDRVNYEFDLWKKGNTHHY